MHSHCTSRGGAVTKTGFPDLLLWQAKEAGHLLGCKPPLRVPGGRMPSLEPSWMGTVAEACWGRPRHVEKHRL